MRRILTNLAFMAALGYMSVNIAYAATAESKELLEPVFVFRGLLSIAMAVLAWYATKMANKVDELERKVISLEALNQRLSTQESLSTSLRQEDNQQQTQINMLREQILRDYHTKEETREHFHNMEKLMEGLREEMRNLCLKFEGLQERFWERRSTPRHDN